METETGLRDSVIRPPLRGRIWAAAVAIIVMLFVMSAAASESLRGRTVAEAISILQAGGLPVVYSDAVVKPGMRVAEEPGATTPRGKLVEILRPHGLAVRPAGGRLYVVPLSATPPFPGSEASGDARFDESIEYLEEITVSPGQLALAGEITEDRVLLTSEQIDAMPHPGDDLMRAVRALPGMTSDDASAQFHVRGGAVDELLVMIDGQEIYEPFHLKDFMSVFSVLDTEAVEIADVFAGGFPVEYGDRMSGVMDVSVIRPREDRGEVMIGTLHSRLMTAGSLAQDRGSWLLTGRLWYPESIPKRVGFVTADELQTDYYDVLGRVTWKLGSRSELFAGSVIAYDDLAFVTIDDGETDRVDARYVSEQFWAGHSLLWSPELDVETVLSASFIDRERAGGYVSPEDGDISVVDDRRFEFFALRQGVSWLPVENHLVKAGFEIRRQQADYDYRRVGEQDDSIERTLEPAATTLALWISDRTRIGPLVLEGGLRWDRQSHLEEQQWSPRLNARWQIRQATAFRLGWGHYSQTERLNELQIQDGVIEFSPPQSSEQLMASLEHYPRPGLLARIALWDKRYEDLRPRWENLFNPIELFPEVENDRIMIEPERGRARGVELVLRRGPSDRRFSWWAGYTLSEAFDVIDGEEVSRTWDVRHSFDAGLDLELPWRFRLSLGARIASGLPITGGVVVEEEGELVVEPSRYHDQRLPSYQRLDARVTRAIPLTRGDLLVILEILNLTNAGNVCCIDDFAIEETDDGFIAVPETRGWTPFVPSLAVSWSF